MWLSLYTAPLPVIAAINGAAPAGGCLMAMSCDYRIMAQHPKFNIGLNETLLGIVAPTWFMDTMIRYLLKCSITVKYKNAILTQFKNNDYGLF